MSETERARDDHAYWASVCTCGLADQERTGHHPEHSEWCDVPSPLDEDECDVPGCNQISVYLVANDAPLDSTEYAERYVCRWHERNPSGGKPDSWQWLGMSR